MSKNRNKTKLFTEIYSNYYSIVFGSIFSKIKNNEVSADICQEVFIRFYEKMEKVENPRKWLLGTLHLVILEYYKSKENKIQSSDIEESINDISLSYINGFRDLRIIVDEAIEDMDNFKDEKERVLFELVAVRKFTYKEAGQELGFTAPQVKYKYKNILARLIDYFRKKGISSLEELL